MEAMILASTEEKVFIGDRPHTPQEYLKRFMLVMGYSGTNFSTNRRATATPQASKRGPRQMLGESAIAEIYGDRYLRRKESPRSSGVTLASVEKLLAEGSEDSNVKDAMAQSEAALIGGTSNSDKDAKRPKKSVASHFAKSHGLTAIQLLTSLESAMRFERSP